MSPKKRPDASPPASDLPEGFSAVTRAWFTSAFATPTPAQVQAWEAIGRGENTLVVAPTGSGKTLAAFLWSLDRITAGADSGRSSQPLPGALHLAIEGAGGRRRAQPARSPSRHATRGHPPRPPRAHGRGRAAFRRHPSRRTPKAHDQAARHLDHDSRVAVLDPHVCGTRVTARHRHGDRRRSARGCGHQARRASCTLTRAARRHAREARATHRVVGDGPTGRRDRPIPQRLRGSRPSSNHRR